MIHEEVTMDFGTLTRNNFVSPAVDANHGHLQQQSLLKARQQNGNVLQNSSLSECVYNNDCYKLKEKLNSQIASTDSGNSDHTSGAQSTIAILRRHPMYDSLILVKRFCPSINGFVLELPTSELAGRRKSVVSQQQELDDQNGIKSARCQSSKNNGLSDCNKTKLTTVYLEGDDPIYQMEQERYNNKMGDGCELVYVPMNGLTDRLDNFERQGTSIDGRVYAFALGLKTAERFLTSSNMKEIQETPPL